MRRHQIVHLPLLLLPHPVPHLHQDILLNVICYQEQEAAASDPDIAEKRKKLVQADEEEVDHYVKLLEDAERSQKEVFLIVVQVSSQILLR